MKSIELLNISRCIIDDIEKTQPKDVGGNLAIDYKIIERKSNHSYVTSLKELFEQFDLSNLNFFGFSFFSDIETINNCDCFATYQEDYLFVDSNGVISVLDFYSHEKISEIGLNFEEFIAFVKYAMLFSSSTFTNADYSKDDFIKSLKKISNNKEFDLFIKRTFE